MKEFEVTMTAVSRKTFRMDAESRREVFDTVNALLEKTGLLDFTESDVERLSVDCQEPGGGVRGSSGQDGRCPQDGRGGEKKDEAGGPA